MSVSSEVQRTLVKSPPELWAELSDADALTRHLGELGEIRITNVEPETKVEWEADDATGVVELKPSGWGTRVTLTVTRNPTVPEQPSEPEPVAAVGEPNLAVQPKPVAVVEPAAVIEAVAEPPPVAPAEPETAEAKSPIAEPGVTTTEPEIEAESAAIAAPETVVEPQPKLEWFFARLFRKRKAKPATVVAPETQPPVSQESAVEPEPEPEPQIEVVTMAAPEPIYPEPPAEPVVDLAAELISVEAQMAEKTTELLSGVLDRLGAAHHRPFSRG